MACKLALFEFVNEDNALEIGDASRIIWNEEHDLNNDSWDIDTVCQVKWPTRNGKTERVAARVLRFSDSRIELKDVLDRLLVGEDLDAILSSVANLGRGRRGKRPSRRVDLSSSDEENEEPPRKIGKRCRLTKVTSEKTAERNLLELLKEKRSKENHATASCSTQATDAGDLAALRKEVAELRTVVVSLQESNRALVETNRSLVSTVTSLAELPHIVEQLRATLMEQRANHTDSTPSVALIPNTPRTDLRADGPSSHTDDSSADEAENMPHATESSDMIPQHLLRKVNRSNARKMTNDIMHGMFTEEFMSSHSVGGASRGNGKTTRPPIDPILVNSITDVVIKEFPSMTVSAVKSHMREKLSNCAKNVRRRQQNL